MKGTRCEGPRGRPGASPLCHRWHNHAAQAPVANVAHRSRWPGCPAPVPAATGVAGPLSPRHGTQVTSCHTLGLISRGTAGGRGRVTRRCHHRKELKHRWWSFARCSPLPGLSRAPTAPFSRRCFHSSPERCLSAAQTLPVAECPRATGEFPPSLSSPHSSEAKLRGCWGGTGVRMSPVSAGIHRMFGVGRDLCGSSSPTPLPSRVTYRRKVTPMMASCLPAPRSIPLPGVGRLQF